MHYESNENAEIRRKLFQRLFLHALRVVAVSELDVDAFIAIDRQQNMNVHVYQTGSIKFGTPLKVDTKNSCFHQCSRDRLARSTDPLYQHWPMQGLGNNWMAAALSAVNLRKVPKKKLGTNSWGYINVFAIVFISANRNPTPADL
jgi:hypothetical protein